MGLAAKRFLHGRLQRRLKHQQSVIPLKAVVVQNGRSSSHSTLLPTNPKAFAITHQSVAMSPPLVTIILNEFRTYCSQGRDLPINRSEKQRNGCAKPTIAKIPLQDHGDECTAESVPSSSILFQTHHGAINRVSGKKGISFPNRNHQAAVITLPRAEVGTTETKTYGSKTIQQTLSPVAPIRKRTIPKQIRTHCNEGRHWIVNPSGKKQRSKSSPRGVAKRSSKKSKPTHKARVLKHLQSHCAEGRYWEVDPSSTKRKRSANKRLVEFSPEEKKKRKTRMELGRRRNTIIDRSTAIQSAIRDDKNKPSILNEKRLTAKAKTQTKKIPSKWFWLPENPNQQGHQVNKISK